ncbi:MAG: GH25 family lysozyme [Bacillota bacterium]
MKKKSIILLALIILAALVIYLEYTGYIWHNEVFASKYNIKGLDVSNHQGSIDWVKVKQGERYKFAFIKATEGNDYKDKYFLENWNKAKEVDILRGAYHYFTTGSSGKEQAQNFISIVPREEGTLPPVVDLEVHGKNRDDFIRQLKDFVYSIEQYYEQKPILYVMYPHYEAYVKGDFKDNAIWIRDIVKYPQLSDNREWKFWQYSNRGHVKGIDNYVDLNCFSGSLEELISMVK